MQSPPLRPKRLAHQLRARNGGIRWQKAWVNVSHVLAEETVGVVKLGRFSERTGRIEDDRGLLRVSPVHNSRVRDMESDEDTGDADIRPPPIRHWPIELATHEAEAHEPNERSIGRREEAHPAQTPSGLREEAKHHPGEAVQARPDHE
jgi:hypothetical protein